MAQRLRNTVALVTGASSGIGEATALQLAADGATVAIAARREERLDELARKIRDAGAHALVVVADVSDREQAVGCVETTVADLGRLDIVVNNAGQMLLGPVAEQPVEEIDRMLALNLQGLIHVSQAALPHLRSAAQDPPRRVADLVNVSSVAGRRANAGAAVYNATKHGVGAFSEALRQEVTREHVRVSLVEPGAVATELLSHNRPEIQEASARRLGDLDPLRAQDIADAISFVVTRPRHVAVNEVLVRPTEQQQ